MTVTAAASLLAQASEQGVAGRMAEGVVVVLEAVQVEHAQCELVRRRRLVEQCLHVGEQFAAVGEAGQRVGQCVDLALLQQLVLLASQTGGAIENTGERKQHETERDGLADQLHDMAARGFAAVVRAPTAEGR